jgi:uncharacterized protein YkwD
VAVLLQFKFGTQKNLKKRITQNMKQLRDLAHLVIWVLVILAGNSRWLNAAESASGLVPIVGIGPSLHPDFEQAIVAAVNRLRSDRGLCELKFSEAARARARKQSMTMARHGYLAHHDFFGRELQERLIENPALQFRAAGENIARNRGFFEPAAEAVGGWVNSQGHLANILDARFTETGVGIAVDSEGMFYFTQIFLSK